MLPDYVLQAETVAVVIQPGAGEPVANPTANRTIAVRKGHGDGPTIVNSPTDNRPVTVQSGGGTTRVDVQQGRPSDLTTPLPGEPAGPRPANEIGSTEDSFEVYRGRVQYPLDAAPLWRYIAKDALDSPQVRAVEEFRKAITESEKAQKDSRRGAV